MTYEDFPTETVTGYTPTEEDQRSLAEWFEQYDSASATSDLQRMAQLAAFPLNLVTDDSTGSPWHGQWDQEEYVRTMSQVMGGDAGEVSFQSNRTPFFLSSSIVVVFSRSTMTDDGHAYQLDYADVLVREREGWRFQTMIQPGWGDMLRQRSN